jgi:F-box and WD-40 domain protein CDC4
MTLGQEDLSPPATPPTHSPIPQHLELQSSCACEPDVLGRLKTSFHQLSPLEKQYFLYDMINSCDNSQLAYLNSLIAPRLKVDFLKELPPEIALQILSNVDQPKYLARTACVSKYWNSLLRDESLWKSVCKKHKYIPPTDQGFFSYRDYFKHKYSIATAWCKGGKVTTVDDGFSQGLVTSLQFDDKYTVVGCDNHRIEVFDTKSGKKIRTLEGHEGGVWALQFKGGDKDDPERVLLSGGCDR